MAASLKELIQKELNTRQLKAELDKCLEGAHRENLISEYKRMKERLGGGGASEKAATIIVEEAA